MPSGLSFQAIVNRERPARAIHRLATIAGPARDEALVAWLASRPAAQSAAAEALWESGLRFARNDDEVRSSVAPTGALDRALEALGV
jgi:hypothetical protein